MLLGWEREMRTKRYSDKQGAGNHPIKKWGESDSR